MEHPHWCLVVGVREANETESLHGDSMETTGNEARCMCKRKAAHKRVQESIDVSNPVRAFTSSLLWCAREKLAGTHES
jgi:hypothetical protein